MKLSELHPKKNPAYSPNLYRWMRKHGAITREWIEMYKSDDGRTYLGTLEADPVVKEFCGTVIGSILTEGGRAEDYCHMGLTAKNLTKVEGFWEEYLRIGRCALDKDHYIYGDERWDETGDTRVCKWCGRVEMRERYTFTEQRERWVYDAEVQS